MNTTAPLDSRTGARSVSVTDALDLLIVTEALRDYASREYREATALRTVGYSDRRPDAGSWDAATRERFAQGCDLRSRRALELATNLENSR